jgi:23S rRNA (adenine-N6)-dimethyltransferase
VGARERGLRRAPLRPSGQHLLRSAVVAAELIELAGVRDDDLVVEIGAGTGRITRALAAAARRVIAIELDPAFVEHLRWAFRGDSAVTIIEGDFLSTPLPRVTYRAFGNLPFASTTDIMRRLLDDPTSPLARADLIVQVEVARKRASIWPSNLTSLGWVPWWEFRVVRRLPAAAFEPRPSVDAAVLSITRRQAPLLPTHQRLPYLELLRAAFRYGSAPIRQSLRGRVSPRAWKRLARDRGIPPHATARELDVFDWMAVFRASHIS